MMATINDIAKLVNKSPATVSRALNNNKRISKATRLKVIEAAKQMGYRPSMTARNLRSGKSMTVALGISDLMNPAHTEYTRALEIYLNEKGYELLIMENMNTKKRLNRSIEMMIRDGCDGAVLNCGPYRKEMVQEMLDYNIPVFMFGYGKEFVNLAADGLNPDREPFKQAIQHLLDLGHRNIKFVFSYTKNEGAPENYHEIISFLKKAGYEDPMSLHVYTKTENMLEDGYWAGKKILDDFPETTAIFCTNEYNAVGVMKALSERSVRIPEDISIIAPDNTWIGKYSQVSLTTIDLSKELCAKITVETLLKRIQNGISNKPERILVPTRFIVRDSTGPVRK